MSHSRTRYIVLGMIALLLAATPRAASSHPAASTSPATSTEPRFAVPFIADDYAKALHEARARKVPIFIEAWAPW
jgi:hypothetical protein